MSPGSSPMRCACLRRDLVHHDAALRRVEPQLVVEGGIEVADRRAGEGVMAVELGELARRHVRQRADGDARAAARAVAPVGEPAGRFIARVATRKRSASGSSISCPSSDRITSPGSSPAAAAGLSGATV